MYKPQYEDWEWETQRHLSQLTKGSQLTEDVSSYKLVQLYEFGTSPSKAAKMIVDGGLAQAN